GHAVDVLFMAEREARSLSHAVDQITQATTAPASEDGQLGAPCTRRLAEPESMTSAATSEKFKRRERPVAALVLGVISVTSLRRNAMKRTRALVLGLGAVLAVALGATAQTGLADGPKLADYRVTFVNLSGGQPFSPPVAATHQKSIRMFQVGRLASDELAAIA